MKALVIAPQPFFTPRGTPFSVYYRMLIASELGVKIDLLTYGDGQDVDIPGLRIIRIPRFTFLGPVKIGPSYQKLFLDIFILIWTVGLLLSNRYNFVHAHEEAVFFCRYLKPIFRFKLIYDMHSSLPQQLTNFQFTRSGLIIGLFKKLEDSCLKAADVIITICPDLAYYVKGIVRDLDKHIMIENSIFEPVMLLQKCATSEEKTGSPSDLNELFSGLPKGKRFVVYAGTLEPYQGIDLLIKAFASVTFRSPDAFLLIIGGTVEQVNAYKSLAESIGLDGNVLFTGKVAQQTARKYNNMASVLVSPRCNGTNTPLKIYEQIASGIPLVATSIYSHTQVLNKEVAFLVNPEPDDMARGIISALKSNDSINGIAANAKKLYRQKYSRPVYEEKMHRVLELLSS